jgi:predicted transcriptional regulator
MTKKLLDCEWTLLRALWGKKPQSMKQIIAAVNEDQPDIKWSYKTYHSYLRLMLEKGLIGCEIISARDKRYFAVIKREQALKAESESLLSRISIDSMGRLVAMMAKEGQLLDSDKQKLATLFEQLNRDGEEK